MILVFQHHDKPTSRASAALAVETERTARCGRHTRRSSIGQTFRSPMVPFVLRLRLQRRRKDPNVSGPDGPPDLEAAWVVVVDVLCFRLWSEVIETLRGSAGYVATLDNRRRSLYGAPWLQPMATRRKSVAPRNGSDRRKLLPWVATGCDRVRMVRRGSTVRVGESLKRGHAAASACGRGRAVVLSAITTTLCSVRLSRLVSRTRPQRAWLSQMRAVSKTVRGGFVPRGFESLPLRSTEKTHDYAVSRHLV
jgi:hypothetical protein